MIDQNNFQLKLPKWPVYGEDEKSILLETLESNKWWRGSGKQNALFEKEFSDFIGTKFTRLTSSGSGAIEIALQLGDILPGDEVLVPACTFIATASSVLRMGAIPIPVDVDPETLCISIPDLEKKITIKSKCIIPVHMAGQGADMDAIMQLASVHNLFVIEDAAHAHGAVWQGQNLGAIGHVGIFSFQNGKLMTAGEGGAVVTNDPVLAKRSFALHSCGRPEGDTVYEHLEIAGNWRATEFSAGILRAQLRRLPEQLKIREARASYFDNLMEGIPGVTPLVRDMRTNVHSHYMSMFWIDDAYLVDFGDVTGLASQLRDSGILAFKCFPSVHRTKMFSEEQLKSATMRSDMKFPRYDLIETPNSDAASRNVIWFHHSLLLAEEQVLDEVVEHFSSTLGKQQLEYIA